MYTANDARQDIFPLKGMVTGSEATQEVKGFPLGLTVAVVHIILSSSNSTLPGGGLVPPPRTPSRTFLRINHPDYDGGG